MKPVVSLSPVREHRLPEERMTFKLTVANPTSEAITVALPSHSFWRAARLRLTRPDGSAETFRLGEPAPAGDADERLQLFEEAELEHVFALESVVRGLGAPGPHVVEGVLQSAEGEWPIPAARVVVEAPRPSLVVVSPSADPEGQEPIAVWSITKGVHRAALSLRQLIPDDGATGNGLQATPPELVCDVGLGASSLAAGGSWVAWLEPDGLHAGFNTSSFYQVEPVSLPGSVAGAGRLVGPLLARSDGGVDAFVCLEDHILWLRLPPPVAVVPPQPDDDDDDEFPAPSAYLRFPPAERLGSFAVPSRGPWGIAARPPGTSAEVVGGDVAIAAAFPVKTAAGAPGVPVPSGIELRFGLLAHDQPARWTTVRIAEAELIAGASPAVLQQHGGVTHVAVLCKRTTASGATEIGLATAAFDVEGFPLLTEGLGPQWSATSAQPVTSGIVVPWVDPLLGSFCTGWLAQLADGTCLLRKGLAPPARIRPTAAFVQPLALVASPIDCAGACQHDDGTLFFCGI